MYYTRRILCLLGVCVSFNFNAVAATDVELDVTKFLETAVEQTGIWATQSAFLDFAQRFDVKEEWDVAWNLWSDGLSGPPLGKDDLVETLSASRNSISSLHYRASVIATDVSTSEVVRAVDYEWALDRNRLLRVAKFSLRTGKEHKHNYVIGFDGDRAKVMSGPVSEGVFTAADAAYEPSIERRRFFDTWNILGSMMLADAEADYGLAQLYIYDLRRLILDFPSTFIYYEYDDDLRKELLVVGYPRPSQFIAYLDPDLNYSLVRFDTYRVKREQDRPWRAVSRQLTSRRVLTDYEQFANGVMLPLSITITSYSDSGSESLIDVHSVHRSSVTVNTPLPVELFRPEFPPNATVQDVARGETFKTNPDFSSSMDAFGQDSLRDVGNDSWFLLAICSVFAVLLFGGLIYMTVRRKEVD